MQKFAGLDEFLLTTLIGLVVAVIVGGVLLRMAIALYNVMVGIVSSSKRVPAPEFDKLALIIFVTGRCS